MYVLEEKKGDQIYLLKTFFLSVIVHFVKAKNQINTHTYKHTPFAEVKKQKI